MNERSTSRRGFLQTTGASTAAALLGPQLAFSQDAKASAPPADISRQLEPTGADMGSLFPEIERLAETTRFEYSFLEGRFDSLAEFKQTARDKVLEVFRYRPPRVPPRPQVLQRDDLGEYVREKIVFSTGPNFRVPAYVLVPKNRKQPGPAIVDLHSHGGMFLFGKEKVVDLGDNHPAMTAYHKRNYDGRPTATELVRRGYVVMTIDAFMFGERRLILDEDLKYGYDRSKYRLEDVRHLNQKCRNKEHTLAKSLVLAGMTWPGIVTWDDMRTVDYLSSRPEVDPKRIGCVGISLGGHRSYYLAGMDERIAAAVVVGFMSTVKPMIKAHIDTHSWVHFLPGLHGYLDIPDVVSMMAPKPLLVQQCRRDALFPPEGMKDAVEKIAAVYEKAGAREKFEGRFYEIHHTFSQPMQDEAFAWLDKQLKR